METNLMSIQTDKLLSTSWNLVRDAGSAVGDAAVNSQVGSNLVRVLPKVKNFVSTGAGLVLARRAGKVAVAAVRRNPLAAIAGAVALAGVGLVIAVAKKRKLARENGDASAGKPPRPRRLSATNMRDTASTTRVAAEKKPRTPRARKAASKTKSSS